ncbi:Uncharacterised protein g792 [Pycnogonum litorale]
MPQKNSLKKLPTLRFPSINHQTDKIRGTHIYKTVTPKGLVSSLNVKNPNLNGRLRKTTPEVTKPAVTISAADSFAHGNLIQPLTSKKFALQQKECNRSGSNKYLKKVNHTNVARSMSNDSITKQFGTPSSVRQYLTLNPSFLDDYVRRFVSTEQLERWMVKKAQNGPKERSSVQIDGARRKPSLSKWKLYVHTDKKRMLQEMTHGLFTKPNPADVILELASCISSAVEADDFCLYLMDRSSGHLSTYLSNTDRTAHELKYSDNSLSPKGITFAEYVARHRTVIRTTEIEKNPLFPGGISVDNSDITAVMCHPLIQPDGEILGVLELYKKGETERFDEEDEEISDSYLVWGGIALHYAELYSKMIKQETQNNFILTVVKSIFQDMVTMDTVIKKIMNFAQKLVDADRASLFLVDHKTHELYARIFDMGGQQDSSEQEESKNTKEKEIRFPIGRGIAGHVALTGKSLNIPDAYLDERFNRKVDLQTGYQTRNILCMPIFNRGRVIGVVQMVNKLDGTVFTSSDEEGFSTFAVYCGLALHHAKLYDKIRKSEQKYKVAWEILSYHALSTNDDVKSVEKCELSSEKVTKLQEYRFSPYEMNSEDKVHGAIHMFKDLFGLNRFDYDCLLKFTLTVRKNYRRVPYHNWTHGFSVANSIYAILKRCNVFSPVEELSLFVACLCHDLDHRGVNNQFLIKTSSPLASMYTTSPLENHHFNHTVSILQQEGHNIFKHLSSDEFKDVLRNIKHCILATDLAAFFPNKAKLTQIIAKNEFDASNQEHKLLLQAITMTACDLVASSKPWDQQVETVKVIFQEFYEQGDAERARGSVPIPMMDRTKEQEQPTSQIGFLKGICLPCYELLVAVIPEAQPLLDGCRKNLERWQEIEMEQKVKIDTETKE